MLSGSAASCETLGVWAGDDSYEETKKRCKPAFDFVSTLTGAPLLQGVDHKRMPGCVLHMMLSVAGQFYKRCIAQNVQEGPDAERQVTEINFFLKKVPPGGGGGAPASGRALLLLLSGCSMMDGSGRASHRPHLLVAACACLKSKKMACHFSICRQVACL
jgi:hypothetical protein